MAPRWATSLGVAYRDRSGTTNERWGNLSLRGVVDVTDGVTTLNVTRGYWTQDQSVTIFPPNME